MLLLRPDIYMGDLVFLINTINSVTFYRFYSHLKPTETHICERWFRMDKT